MTPEREAQMREAFAKWADEYGFYPELQDVHQYAKTVALDSWLACARALEPMVRDGERLDWMISHEAWISWCKDRELCRVFVHGDDGPEPFLGWGAGKAHHTAREAIDAAMSAALEDGNATE